MYGLLPWDMQRLTDPQKVAVESDLGRLAQEAN